MDTSPTDEELRAFIDSMLSNLDKQLRAPDVIEQTMREHRDMWVKLYLAGLGFEVPDAT